MRAEDEADVVLIWSAESFRNMLRSDFSSNSNPELAKEERQFASSHTKKDLPYAIKNVLRPQYL